MSLKEPRLGDGEEVGALLIDLVDHLDAMVAYWDVNQVCRFANRAYKVWFGRDRQELLGTTLKELLGPLYDMNRPHIEAAYRGERQVFERAIPRPDGRGERHSLATYVPRLVDGLVVGIFVHVADVEPLKELEFELKAAHRKAEKLATHDFLTGLPNRVLLHARIDDAISNAARAGGKVYVLSVDIDHFKLVNDTYGHAAGDRLLIEVATRIKASVRDADTVIRVGGDEFLVLATGAPEDDGAGSLPARILECVRQPYAMEGTLFSPSVSIGVACYPAHGLTKEALLLSSDLALYAAKRADRNCFRVADAVARREA